MSLLGIDMGTTGVKAVAFNHDGEIIASAYREYPLLHPKSNWAELDSNRVWKDTEEVLQAVAAQTRHDPVQALAVSSQGEAVTPMDAHGNFLDNAIISFDGRTADDVKWWEEELGKEEIFNITGHSVSSVYTALKVKWLREHKPEVYSTTKKFLLFTDLVFQKLGAEPRTDYSMAGRTMMFDVRRKEWSDKIFDTGGIDKDLFFPTVPSGTRIGTISDSAAEKYGLPGGVTVVTGGHDQPMASLGAGVIKPNIAMYGVGTVECIAVAFADAVINDVMMDNNICCYNHTRPGMFISLIYNFTGGSLFRWYRDNLAREELRHAEETGRDVYDLLCEPAPSEPTDLLVLPHFTSTGTPYFDNHSRGAILGLQLSTKKEEITRAILEGITYELKQSVDLLEDAGVPVNEFRTTGGGSKSDFWMQIKADILNKPVVAMDVSEAGCLGCAILAGVATGVYSSYEEAVEILAKPRRVFEPNPRHAEIYQSKMDLYRQIYPNLREIFHQM